MKKFELLQQKRYYDINKGPLHQVRDRKEVRLLIEYLESETFKNLPNNQEVSYYHFLDFIREKYPKQVVFFNKKYLEQSNFSAIMFHTWQADSANKWQIFLDPITQSNKEILTSKVATDIWKNIIGFVPRRDYGAMKASCKFFKKIIEKIAAIDYSEQPELAARYQLKGGKAITALLDIGNGSILAEEFEKMHLIKPQANARLTINTHNCRSADYLARMNDGSILRFGELILNKRRTQTISIWDEQLNLKKFWKVDFGCVTKLPNDQIVGVRSTYVTGKHWTDYGHYSHSITLMVKDKKTDSFDIDFESSILAVTAISNNEILCISKNEVLLINLRTQNFKTFHLWNGLEAVAALHEGVFAVGDEKGFVSVYDLQNGKISNKFQASNNAITALNVSDSGDILTGALDGEIGIWSFTNSKHEESKQVVVSGDQKEVSRVGPEPV